MPASPMPRIGTGLPAFASDISYPPGNLNDDNYANQVATTALPYWWATDISGLSSAKRTNVVMLLDNETGNYIIGPAQGYPTNYTIQASNAAGGGSAPADTDPSWTTLVTITGATVPRHMHVLGDLRPYNWVRVRITAVAASDATLHLQAIDLFDGSATTADSWLIIGDSTTQEGGTLVDPTTGVEWTHGGPIARKVNSLNATHWPLIVSAGDGGENEQWMHDNMAALLAGFSGGYVLIQMGLNDANGNPDLSLAANAGVLSTWYSNLLYCVDQATAAGKTVMLGKVQWAYANAVTAGNAQILNQKIEQALTVDRPASLRGPDMYSAFNGQTTLIRSDHLHPTFGSGGGYELWIATMAQAIATAYNVTAESDAEALMQLTGLAGETAAEVYAKWAGLSVPTGGEGLEQLVRKKLTANGKTGAAGKESLLAMLLANGGGPAETVEQCLLKSGLTGWS